MSRVWDRFLTEQDRAHAAATRGAPIGAGQRPAVLLVDLYRWVFGDRPQPLLEAVREWPGSCGLAGWEALPHIQRLLETARAHGVPVIHATGQDELFGWGERPSADLRDTVEKRERRRFKYTILDEVAPRNGEVVIKKTSPSAFWGTPLVGLLVHLGVDTLVVAGESTSGCVRATVVDGRTHRYRVLVPEECVFDRTEASHAMSLFDMDRKYADVLPLAEVLAYLANPAGQADGRAAAAGTAAAEPLALAGRAAG